MTQNKNISEKKYSILVFLLIFLLLTPILINTNVNASDIGDNEIRTTYHITNVWELQNMSNDLSGDYILDNDIDASITNTWNGGNGFIPIGNVPNKFTGTFSGNNYTISNLFINNNLDAYIGLFGRCDYSKINNLNLVNINITGNTFVGGLVGYSYNSSLDNIFTSGNITAIAYVGGICGITEINNIIINSSSNCNITGFVAGGICGLQNYYINSVAKNCYIINCYATGNIINMVLGNDFSGGLIGDNYGYIYTSYATGNVNGKDYVGGFVGRNDGVINNSYATGNVTGIGDRVGGVGGFVGVNNGIIENSYSVGYVNGILGIGGLIGINSLTTIDSYYDKNTSNQLDEGKGNPKTTEEMKTQSTFINWDFDDVWTIREGITYPLFVWQDIGINAIAPEVIDIYPQDSQINVSIDSNIIILFNQSMNTTSVENSILLNPEIDYTTNWTINNTTLTIIFDNDLDYNTTYNMTIGIGSKDVNETNMAENYTFSFTTIINTETTEEQSIYQGLSTILILTFPIIIWWLIILLIIKMIKKSLKNK